MATFHPPSSSSTSTVYTTSRPRQRAPSAAGQLRSLTGTATDATGAAVVAPLKALEPDRWFRIFDQSDGKMIRLDVAPWRDEEVVSLSGRLRELAGFAQGNVTLDLSMVEEYSTAWYKALADLATMCHQLGGQLQLVGLCPKAAKVFEDTKRLHTATGRLRPGTNARDVRVQTPPAPASRATAPIPRLNIPPSVAA